MEAPETKHTCMSAMEASPRLSPIELHKSDLAHLNRFSYLMRFKLHAPEKVLRMSTVRGLDAARVSYQRASNPEVHTHFGSSELNVTSANIVNWLPREVCNRRVVFPQPNSVVPLDLK